MELFAIKKIVDNIEEGVLKKEFGLEKEILELLNRKEDAIIITKKNIFLLSQR